MSKIPAFPRPTELEFAYIKYVSYDVKPEFLSAVDVTTLWKTNKLGFFFKKPGLESYVPFSLENFAVASVHYSIDGYNREPTYYSSKSLDKKGPYIVYDAKTNVSCFMGAYHYDKPKHAHVVGGDILPAGCRRTTTLVGVPAEKKGTYDGFIYLRLGAFLRNAVIAAIKEAIIADGQKPSEYITVGDMVAERQFWMLRQKRDKDGYPIFEAQKSDEIGRESNVFFVPTLEAIYIEDETIQQKVYERRKEYEAYMFERMTKVRDVLVENGKHLDAIPDPYRAGRLIPEKGASLAQTHVTKAEKGQRFNPDVFPKEPRQENVIPEPDGIEPLPF